MQNYEATLSVPGLGLNLSLVLQATKGSKKGAGNIATAILQNNTPTKDSSQKKASTKVLRAPERSKLTASAAVTQSSVAETAQPIRLAAEVPQDNWSVKTLSELLDTVVNRRLLEHRDEFQFEMPPCVVSPDVPRKVVTDQKPASHREVQLSNVCFASAEEAASRLGWPVKKIYGMLEQPGFRSARYTERHPNEIMIKAIIVESVKKAAEVLTCSNVTVYNMLNHNTRKGFTTASYTGRYRVNYGHRSTKTGKLYKNAFHAYKAEGINPGPDLKTEVYDTTFAV